jgi:hypothetical protein
MRGGRPTCTKIIGGKEQAVARQMYRAKRRAAFLAAASEMYNL